MKRLSRLKLFLTPRMKMIETSTALLAFWWFFILILPFDTFSVSHTYYIMEEMMPESLWALLSLGIGCFQMIGMIFNKQIIRKMSLLVATGFWAFLATMFLVGDYRSTAEGTYAIISIMTAWVYLKVKVGGDDDRSDTNQ